MASKTITLLLGGQERTLLYGTMGYFSHIKEASGMDPFEWLQKFDKAREELSGNMIVLIEDTAIMIYAGLNSYLDSTDKTNEPMEKVKKWVNGVPTEQVAEIFKTAFGTITSDMPGESAPIQANGENVSA